MREKDLREAIVRHARSLNSLGLSQGTSGNISARLGESLLITPSAVPYAEMQPRMLPTLALNGEYGAWSGRFKPSSEWRFHLDIMRARQDIGAIVHCHATYATALAMLHKPLPAAHYMIAIFGGPTVRCTPYAPYGTKELSDLAVSGLEDRNAVLLANHGMIATGANLEEAMWRAIELETLAKMYHLALAVGRPIILSDDEVMRTVERFKNYGQKFEDKPRKPRVRGKATAQKKARTKRGAPSAKKGAA